MNSKLNQISQQRLIANHPTAYFSLMTQAIYIKLQELGYHDTIPLSQGYIGEVGMQYHMYAISYKDKEFTYYDKEIPLLEIVKELNWNEHKECYYQNHGILYCRSPFKLINPTKNLYISPESKKLFSSCGTVSQFYDIYENAVIENIIYYHGWDKNALNETQTAFLSICKHSLNLLNYEFKFEFRLPDKVYMLNHGIFENTFAFDMQPDFIRHFTPGIELRSDTYSYQQCLDSSFLSLQSKKFLAAYCQLYEYKFLYAHDIKRLLNENYQQNSILFEFEPS